MPIIFGPSALRHECVEKSANLENVLCVGRSENFDQAYDFMNEATDKNLIIRSAT